MGSYKKRKIDNEADKPAKIVFKYKSVNKVITIEHDDITAEDTEYSYDNFIELSQSSDEIYLDISNANRKERRHGYSSDSINDQIDLKSKPIEEIIILKELIGELRIALKSLTDVQRRRVGLFYFYGMSEREIALLENVDHMAVHRNIKAA